MAKRDYFRRSYKLIGKATPQPHVEDEKAPSGCETHYHRVIALNGTTANTDVIMQVNEHDRLIPVGRILNMPVGIPGVCARCEIIVQGDEILRLQWADTLDGDDLTITLEGYLWAKA